MAASRRRDEFARANVKRILADSGKVLCMKAPWRTSRSALGGAGTGPLHGAKLEEAQRRLEVQSRELQKTRDDALDASRMKSEFLA